MALLQEFLMKQYDIIIIGGGAAGLMCVRGAQDAGTNPKVLVLEKMPKPGRKIMITGKGRCNFSNLKNWNEFSQHVPQGAQFLRPSFMSLPPEKVQQFFEKYGCPTVLERGDRLFPASHRSADIVDTLSKNLDAAIRTGYTVESIRHEGGQFVVNDEYAAAKLVIATGGKSYPGTGSEGDGYAWAKQFGHSVTPLFPSLTALVPRDERLLTIGAQEILTIENAAITLFVDGQQAQYEEGDLAFTSGGIEGPIGFKVSRKAVKAMINGGKVSVDIDLKPAVSEEQLAVRIGGYLSSRMQPRDILRKLLPTALIPYFVDIKPQALPRRLKCWHIDIASYVGWERAVVTAGGVSLKEINPKTLESRVVSGLYFAGEILDIDCATGGYNLQTAFCTGYLAGLSASATSKKDSIKDSR